MIIGYARVSSSGQNESSQVDLLRAKGAAELFIDKASGTSRDGRPRLAEAIRFARKGDAIMVTRLDRLARSVMDLNSISVELLAKGVDLMVTEQAIDTSTPTGRLMFNMLGAIAEFETELRRERQLEGIAKAKADRRYLGRPVTIDAEAILTAHRAGDKPQHIAKRFGIARSSVYRVIGRSLRDPSRGSQASKVNHPDPSFPSRLGLRVDSDKDVESVFTAKLTWLPRM